LILAHKKHSKDPGDSPAMIQSRRRFLDQGFYDRVSDGINEVVAGNLRELEDGTALSMLDAGCGEGFYLKRLKEYLMGRSEGRIPLDCYGVDISKFAIGKAAQRDKTTSWAVANIVDLPFASGSLDIVMNVFALADFNEFSRILRETGKLVIVTPGPRHLNGLREIIYPVSREHTQSEMSEQAKALFTLSTSTRVNYPLELKRAEEIMDLLAMTPYFWNIDLNTRTKVEALRSLELDVDVVITVFNKTGK
jgi:23S rRNA (guanine745-N1)-methyltransferase